MIPIVFTAALALVLQEVDIAFAPSAGLSLSKTVLVRHEMSLVEMGSTREGSPLIREDVGGWLVAGTRQAWVDEYLRVAGCRPELFRRTLTRFEGNARMTLSGGRSGEQNAHHESPLAGLAVMHTWIPEEGIWGRCYDELIADEELLEAFDDDADFLGLLPPASGDPASSRSPLTIGATWPAPPNALKSLFAPGGNMASEPTEGGYFERMVEVGLGGDLADVLDKDLAGMVTVTLAELRLVEDRRLAVLQVVFSVSSERDRTRTYLVGMPKEEKREASELQRAVVTWTAEGTAEVLWDLERGHAAGATAQAAETLTAEVFKASAAEGGTPMNISQRTTYGGQLEIEFKISETADPLDEEAPAEQPIQKKKRKGGG